jgi:hypothetical protein
MFDWLFRRKKRRVVIMDCKTNHASMKLIRVEHTNGYDFELELESDMNTDVHTVRDVDAATAHALVELIIDVTILTGNARARDEM